MKKRVASEDDDDLESRSIESETNSVEDDELMHQEGFVDVGSANRRVWLVKIPDFIARKLAEIEDDYGEQDVYIGSVKSVTTPAGATQLVIQMNEDGPIAEEGLPTQFALHSNKPTQQMHLMVESPETGDILAIHGKVEQECYMMPFLDDERYRNVLRTRSAESNAPRRTVQVVQAGEQALGHSIQHVSEHSLLAQQARRRVDTESKRERLPQGDVMNMIFRLFERFERLTFNDILSHTNQPATYLKDLLAEVAIFNKRGPNKNLYELRPEFSSSRRQQ